MHSREVGAINMDNSFKEIINGGEVFQDIEQPLFVLNTGSFGQLGIAEENRLVQVKIFSGGRILLVKENGEVATPYRINNLPPLTKSEMAEAFLRNHFMKIHYAIGGGYRIEASARGLGGAKSRAIHKAVKKGDATKLNNIIQTKVKEQQRYSIDVIDPSGNTPLTLACTKKAPLEIIKMLISTGANVNFSNKDGDTPLTLACTGVDSSVEVIEYLLKQGANINHANKKGYTALAIACSVKSLPIIKCLIQADASMHSLDNDGNSPLHLASLHLASSKLFKNPPISIDIIKVLVEAGADPNQKNKTGRTPLFHVCEANHAEGIAFLLPLTKELNAVISNKTLLMRAAFQGNLPVVRQLLEYGADVNFQSRETENMTALMLACDWNGCRNTSIVDLLIEAGADVNLLDRRNQNALHKACDAREELYNGKMEVNMAIVRGLVNAGINIYQVDMFGRTPLDVARRYKESTCVAYLGSNPRPATQPMVKPSFTRKVAHEGAEESAEQVAIRCLRLLAVDGVKFSEDDAAMFKQVINELLVHSSFITSLIGEEDDKRVARNKLAEEMKKELVIYFKSEPGSMENLARISHDMKNCLKDGIATWVASRANTSDTYQSRGSYAPQMFTPAGARQSDLLQNIETGTSIVNNALGAIETFKNILG